MGFRFWAGSCVLKAAGKPLQVDDSLASVGAAQQSKARWRRTGSQSRPSETLRQHYADQLMHPEWMTEVPDDLEESWSACIPDISCIQQQAGSICKIGQQLPLEVSVTGAVDDWLHIAQAAFVPNVTLQQMTHEHVCLLSSWHSLICCEWHLL